MELNRSRNAGLRHCLRHGRADTQIQGHYIPTLAEQVVRQNALHHQRTHINLKSIAIGNPFVHGGATVFGMWETLCTTTATGLPEPVFNETRCDIMAENLPRCMEVTQTCQNHPDDTICEAAEKVCFDGVAGLYHREAAGPPGSRNLYDGNILSRPLFRKATDQFAI